MGPDFMETELIEIPQNAYEFPITPEELPATGGEIKTAAQAMAWGEQFLEKQQQKGYFGEYTLLQVVHATRENIWYFYYSLDQRDWEAGEPYILSSSAHVAIHGKDGSLLKAWLEEG